MFPRIKVLQLFLQLLVNKDQPNLALSTTQLDPLPQQDP